MILERELINPFGSVEIETLLEKYQDFYEPELDLVCISRSGYANFTAHVTELMTAYCLPVNHTWNSSYNGTDDKGPDFRITGHTIDVKYRGFSNPRGYKNEINEVMLSKGVDIAVVFTQPDQENYYRKIHNSHGVRTVTVPSFPFTHFKNDRIFVIRKKVLMESILSSFRILAFKLRYSLKKMGMIPSESKSSKHHVHVSREILSRAPFRSSYPNRNDSQVAFSPRNPTNKTLSQRIRGQSRTTFCSAFQ